MTAKTWRSTIIKQLKEQDAYKIAYEPVIKTLADILEQRDRTYIEFKESGGETMVPYTNKNGSTNFVKNPALLMWDELNKTALTYWRELGLTPSSYRKLTGDKPGDKQSSGLATALAAIES